MAHMPVLITALGVMGYLALRDVQTRLISNQGVLVLIGLAGLVIATRPQPAIAADLVAGALLLGLGVAYWWRGLIGAGDAKLMLAAGLLVGWDGLMGFALLLLPASGLVLAAHRIRRRSCPPVPGVRLPADLPSGLPYALPVFMATAGSIAAQVLLP